MGEGARKSEEEDDTDITDKTERGEVGIEVMHTPDVRPSTSAASASATVLICKKHLREPKDVRSREPFKPDRSAPLPNDS